MSFCLCFIRSLQLKACTVQSSLVKSISRRRSYSVSNSECLFSRSAHCFSDHDWLACNSGFPILSRPTFFSNSSMRTFSRLNRSLVSTTAGGRPIARALSIPINAAAEGVSCNSITWPLLAAGL